MAVYQQLVITLRPEEAERIAQAAQERGISKTELVRRAVEAYLRQPAKAGK